MQDVSEKIETPLTGLDAAMWKNRLTALMTELGEYHALGNRHFATVIHRSSTLFVSFETVQGIRALSQTAQPFGFELVRSQDWSHLCIISNGDTWFRSPAVYEFFDDLTDDSFFDQFDRILFYGAGPCGYAAAAFSVAAPGSTVVAVQPQATLDARMAEWDPRFVEMRRTSFTDRYGYAPDMLDAAEAAFVLYDPRQEFDAMHAALFARQNVTRLRMPFMGSALQTRLMEMDLLFHILTLAGTNGFDEREFYRLFRARRENASYLRALMGRLDADGRDGLALRLYRNVTARMTAPKFRRRQDTLEEELKTGHSARTVPARL